jgi:hypothetical protein
MEVVKEVMKLRWVDIYHEEKNGHRLYAMLMKMQEKRLSYVLYYVNGGNVREFLSFFRTPKDMSQVTVTVWAILADLHLQYRGAHLFFGLHCFCRPFVCPLFGYQEQPDVLEEITFLNL